jgi:hypothetical protein
MRSQITAQAASLEARAATPMTAQTASHKGRRKPD